MRHCLPLFVCALLAGCVQQPGLSDPGGYALLRTWGEFTEVDGAAPAHPYRLELAPGQHSAEVRYRTLRVDYYCRFEFSVAAGEVYEIIDQSNPHPLRLYRWKRQNSLWANRIDGVAPLHCRETRPGASAAGPTGLESS